MRRFRRVPAAGTERVPHERIPVKPAGVPEPAWWNPRDEEFELGDKNSDGKPIGLWKWWRPNGKLICVAEHNQRGKLHGSLERPLAVAWAPSNQIHVGDERGTIAVFDSVGTPLRTYGSGSLEQVSALAVDADGRAYVLDGKGKRMSKSAGNGIDPLDMIAQYGADAVRYSLVLLTREGQDVKLSEDRFEMGRRFTNKVWNASRFVFQNLEGASYEMDDAAPEAMAPSTKYFIADSDAGSDLRLNAIIA